MAQFTLKNKTITIEDELYDFLKKRYYEFDEEDCKDFISAILTTGDFDTGFSCPDVDKIIDEKSESELSDLISRGAELRRRSMTDNELIRKKGLEAIKKDVEIKLKKKKEIRAEANAKLIQASKRH